MQIQAINYLYNRSVQNVSFGIYFDDVYAPGIKEKGDGIRYEEGNIWSYSHLFRNARFFNQLPLLLADKFPNGAPIYEYACSDGHEALSIIMALENQLPKEYAQKFYPINAFDKNPKIIEYAKQNKLKLGIVEMKDLIGYFPNINYSNYISASKYKDVRNQRICHFNDSTKEKIIFNQGDLFEDLKNKKIGDKPCVLFFRNAWQFLTRSGASELCELLGENLPKGSILIIGDIDILEQSQLVTKITKNGFERINEKYPSQHKIYSDEDDIVVGWGPDDVNKFCFEKV